MANEVPICEEILNMAERLVSEVRQSEDGEIVQIHRIMEGGMVRVPIHSDIPIQPGQLCVVDNRGGVRPIEQNEMEEILRNPRNTVVTSMEYAEDNTPFINVRVNQGSLNILLGDPSGRLAEVIEYVLDEVSIRMLTHPKDKKYPHKCFKCGGKLQYLHALNKAKAKGFTEKQFNNMWKSAAVEFYCCTCFPRISTPRTRRGESDMFDAMATMLNTLRGIDEASERWGTPPNPQIAGEPCQGDGVRGHRADEILADCHHHEINHQGFCCQCGLHSIQIDMMRSERLAEHHRMGTHTFDYINGERLCSVCRLSPEEINAYNNRQGLDRAMSRLIRI